MTAEMEQMPSSQYQHYIPQFLLRRFAIASSPDRGNDKKRNRKPNGKEMLNVVRLDKDPPEISRVLVKRTFGKTDMYKDDSMFTGKDQMRIERKLSDIERVASRIIAKVTDAHEAGKNEISLSRYDKDVLRKFLFVMKYRGLNFFRRFNHQTAEEYDSNDRDGFLEYMRVKNFKRPLDVWFDNLLKIIDMPMDPAGKWTMELFDSIYVGDAVWLFTNIRTMYLAFVTPSDISEEFILTENAFGIHEGPVSCSIDRMTGEQEITAYTEFHVLSVISPRLAMVLRHSYLPEPLEDKDKKVRDGKKEMLAMQAQAHTDPDRVTSLLQDLPVSKARNSYTTIRNGRLVLASGADGVPRATDTFRFLFFPLESRHVQTINTVMLDQAHKISTLVFNSKTALRRALEFYLSSPTQTNGHYSLKTISDRQDDPMLLLFRKLEHLAHSLGSDVKAKYHVDPLMDDDDAPSFDEVIAEVLKTAKPILPNNPLALPMTVLAEISSRSELNITALHALDLILEDDGRPSFPDLVFEAVQLADPANLNQHTKELLKVELHIWRFIWEGLVLRASQVPGADVNHESEHLRGMLAQLNIRPSSRVLPAMARTSPQHVPQTGQDSSVSPPYIQPQKNMGAKAATQASGFSSQGLGKAFDNIGHNIQEQDASLLRNLAPLELEGSALQTNNKRKVARQKIQSPQLGGKRYVRDTFSTGSVGVRNVDASSASMPVQDAVLITFLIGLLVWYYFSG